MNDQSHETEDAEQISRLGEFSAWCLFQAFVLEANLGRAWHAAVRWFKWQRVCAWCRCRLGGNPFSNKFTHGICPRCAAGFNPASSNQ